MLWKNIFIYCHKLLMNGISDLFVQNNFNWAQVVHEWSTFQMPQLAQIQLNRLNNLFAFKPMKRHNDNDKRVEVGNQLTGLVSHQTYF